MRKNNRKVGAITQCAAKAKDQAVPYPLRELTVCNINLYNEMKQHNSNRLDVFEKYEEIIKDLESVIRKLQEKNQFINQQRLRLICENAKLQMQIDSIRDNCFISDSCIKKQSALFEAVRHEDSTSQTIMLPTKKNNQILEQSEFDLNFGKNGHYFSQQIEADISLSEQAKSQERTPCLVNHQNLYTLIQCKSTNNQAPLRIFYLLLLQQQSFILKLREILNFCKQDDSKVLLHLMPNHNAMWAEILENFFDLILQGNFQNQSQIVQYISQNSLIDILLVSLLKQILPVQNEDNDLNIGDWKNEQIDHKAIFQGLCNQFDLIFEQDKENNMHKIYINVAPEHSLSSSISEEMLLESRAHSKEQVEISLLPRTNNMNSGSQSRLQPLFKIWKDSQKQYYRANISIRPEKFNVEEQIQNQSFHMTQKSRSVSIQNSIAQNEQSIPSIKKEQKGMPLMLRDLNKINALRLKKYEEQDYLRVCWQSKELSKNNSFRYEESN